MGGRAMSILKTRRFSVDDYHRMIEAGILGKGDRVELLDGEIVEMSPIGGEHAACVDRCNHILMRHVSEVAQVRIQGPIELDAYSEPEPDVSVLKRRADFYSGGHPTPTETLLLVEVAKSSLAYDRLKKAPAYARRGVRELWIVDLETRTIEVYRGPQAEGYASLEVVAEDGVLRPLAFEGVEIPAREILGG